MKNDLPQATLGIESHHDQFRLVKMQLFNWGTFSKVQDFTISPKGWLFAGPSGSGKSTILDAHSALLSPLNQAGFNSAAKDGGGRQHDRNALTYVRGAWRQQTTSSNETTTDYLRTGSTWSAISEVYRNGHGQYVVLVLVLWVRGSSNNRNDVKRAYLTLQRDFDVRELQFFETHDFDKKRFKFDLPDATVHDEFSAYAERFCRLMQIDSDRTLKLLNKTQSLKTLDNLDEFLRNFMLDEPETREIAAQLVDEFVKLDESHRLVVQAQKQRDTLAPAKAAYDERLSADLRINELKEIEQALDTYTTQMRRQLLKEEMAEALIAADKAEQQLVQLTQQALDADGKLRRLQLQLHELGGSEIADLERQIGEAETARGTVNQMRNHIETSMQWLGWSMPATLDVYVEQVAEARRIIDTADDRGEKRLAASDKIKEYKRTVDEELGRVDAQVAAMKRRPGSLIDYKLQELRDRIIAALNLPSDALPFAGELMEVKTEHSNWRPAIERVLGGFARSLLVEERYFSAVSEYINSNDLRGERIFFHRMMSQSSSGKPLSPESLFHKLNLLNGPHKHWLAEELKSKFDFACVQSASALRAVSRGVTMQGQVKHNTVRHEKDDRSPIHDRSRWVLGFDTAGPLADLETKSRQLKAESDDYAAKLKATKTTESTERRREMASNLLVNTRWEQFDLSGAIIRVAELRRQLDDLQKANPDLQSVNKKIEDSVEELKELNKQKGEVDGEHRALKNKRIDLKRRLDELDKFQEVPMTPTQEASLAMRYKRAETALIRKYADLKREPKLTKLERDVLDEAKEHVTKSITRDRDAINEERAELKAKIERQFKEYNDKWPTHSDGLDPVLASADDYLAKLDRLIKEDLPSFEAKFFEMLNKQSDENLVMLQSKLRSERQAIDNRLDVVNEGLRATSFSADRRSRLVIQPRNRAITELTEFQQDLKALLSDSFKDDRELLERRFESLAKLVKRLGSQEPADKRWRDTVLDVRNHVEFKAKELDENDEELDVLEGGGGKSGGQRQKLTSTILASALRYQLCGTDRQLPIYSTVVMDEAFDKSDSVFTELAINVFAEFGFQMVFATPLKNVSTIEHYIGGGSFIHIVDRNSSRVIPIEYDDAESRIVVSDEIRDVQEQDETAST